MIAIVADVHVGNHRFRGGPVVCGVNERARRTLDVLRSALDTASELPQTNGRTFVVAGDLLDYTRMEPQILAELAAMFAAKPAALFRTVLLLGNHEQNSAAPGDHALGVFASIPSVIVVDRPRLIDGIAYIPYQPGDAREWFLPAFESVEDSDTVACVGHVGIVTSTTPAFLQKAHDAIPEDMAKAVAARTRRGLFVGNWHDPKLIGSAAWQVGALCPTGFDNPGLNFGTMRVTSYDPKVATRTIRIPGPRFATVKWEDREDDVPAFLTGCAKARCEPWIRLVTRTDADTAAALAYASELEAAGARVDVRPTREEAKAAVQKAAGKVASMVASGASSREALSSYVRSLKLSVDPEAVIAEVLRLLSPGAK